MIKINYKFIGPSSDFYECYVSLENLINGPAYDKVLEILKADGIPIESINSVKYRFSECDPWLKVTGIPFTFPVPKPILYLQLIPRFIGVQALPAEINSKIAELEKANRDLRESFESLKSKVAILNLQSSGPLESPQHKGLLVRTSEIDIAYLYSIPLVALIDKRLLPLDNPIDAYNEISILQKDLEKLHKAVSFSVNIGSLERMMMTVEQRPKILHISCHGKCECSTETKVESSNQYFEAKFYLLLEDNKMQGMLAKCSEQDIKDWFTPKDIGKKEVRPRLVFISACYSEIFGRIIRDAGVPNVVAVNGQTQIGDEAATNFASLFYGFLLSGKTVRESFEHAKHHSKVSNRYVKFCCCTHNHKPNCEWLRRFHTSREEGHALHIPDCICAYGGNIHKISCPWVKRVKDFMLVEKHPEGNKIKVCCCSLELAHNEEEKFVLLSQSEGADNEKLFENLPDGELYPLKCFSDEIIPKLSETLIGRNIELQRLVSLLLSDENRIVLVVGAPGNGKKLLVRTAAKYLVERAGDPKSESNKFAHGFSSVALNNTLCLLSKLNTALFNSTAEERSNHTEVRSVAEFQEKIKFLRKIVTLECGNMAEASLLELINTLRKILSEGSKVKFVITANRTFKKLPVDDSVNLSESLSVEFAYQLIKAKNPHWMVPRQKYCEDPLLKKVTSVWAIKQTAKIVKKNPKIMIGQLREKLVEELIVSEETNGVIKENMDCTEMIKNELDIVRNECGGLTPLYLLSFMRTGVFETAFAEWFTKGSSEDYKSNFDAYIEKNKHKGFISKTFYEEIKEYRYTISERLRNYIQSTELYTAESKAPYQLNCIEKLAIIVRQLVKSYRFKMYRRMRHDEFSAFVGEGIWINENSIPDDINNASNWLSSPVSRFELEKENIASLLDIASLNSIIKEAHLQKASELLENVKEITICAVTLITHLGKPNEALELADTILDFAHKREYGANGKSLANPLKKKYREIEGTLRLMKSSMILNAAASELEKEESVKGAEKAEELFQKAENSNGVGEALYLQALYKAKNKYKQHNVIELLAAAKKQFNNSNYQQGIARVCIAEAIFALETGESSNIESLLGTALKIAQKTYYMHNMAAECYYQRAIYYESQKQYYLAKNDLQEALILFETIANTQYAEKCNVMHRRIAGLMQKGKPLLGFLKASPIAQFRAGSLPDEEELIPLEPRVRDSRKFRQFFYGPLAAEHKEILIHFDMLSTKKLKEVFLRSCAVLVISSDHYSAGALTFEDDLGRFERIDIKSLKGILGNIVYNSRCKILVVAIPNGEDVAKMFVDLGVPHVVCFSFDKTEEYERELKYELMYSFTAHFCKCLLKDYPVWSAFHGAKSNLLGNFPRRASFSAVRLSPYDLEGVPLLLPKVPEGVSIEDSHLHSECIFDNLLEGDCVDTSVGKVEDTFDKSTRVFVGREEDLYKVSVELKNGNCVNLYGKPGVGKTRLAEEICNFVGTRGIFQKIIKCHCRDTQYEDLFEPNIRKAFPSSETVGKKRYLVYVDNQDKAKWTRKIPFLNEIRSKTRCVYLTISEDPLGQTPQLNLVPYQLQRFTDESLMIDYICAVFEAGRAINKFSSTLEELLGIEGSDKEQILEAMRDVDAFKQARGYPKLMSAFCNEAIKAQSVHGVDLRRVQSLETKYKKVAKRVKGILEFPGLTMKSQSVSEHIEKQLLIKHEKSYDELAKLSKLSADDYESECEEDLIISDREESASESSESSENSSLSEEETDSVSEEYKGRHSVRESVQSLFKICGPYSESRKDVVEYEEEESSDSEKTGEMLTRAQRRKNKKRQRVTFRFAPKNKSPHKQSL